MRRFLLVLALGLVWLGAAMLFAALFMSWLRPSFCPPSDAYDACILILRPEEPTATGWQAFGFADILLAAAAVAAALGAARAAAVRSRRLWLGVATLGLLAAAGIVAAVLFPPQRFEGGSVHLGAVVALLGTGAITAAGALGRASTDG